MLYDDTLAYSAWTVPPQVEANGIAAEAATTSSSGDLQSLSAIEQTSPAGLVSNEPSLNSKNELEYFDQFVNLLQEQIIVQLEESGVSGNTAASRAAAICKKRNPLGNRFHKCECRECLPCGTWIATPFYITARLPYSGFKLDILNQSTFHLTGQVLSLFVAAGEARRDMPIVAIIFHNHIRVLVRNYGRNRRGSLHRGVDILTKHHTATFRPSTVSFTSAANLLTYTIDKSGCKTKLYKQRSLMQEDFVSKHFILELSGKQGRVGSRKNRKKPTTSIQARKSKAVRDQKVTTETSGELLKKCKLKSSATEQNLVWSIDDCLKVTEQPNGSLYLQNERTGIYLSVNSQHNSMSLQLANLCIILNKSGHLFVAHNKPQVQFKRRANPSQQFRATTTATPISSSNEMRLVREDIDLMSSVSMAGHTRQQQQQSCRNAMHYNGGGNGRNSSNNNGSTPQHFSVNRTMSNSEQFAICGVGGLLVKHHNRRAGLNQKNQICLL